MTLAIDDIAADGWARRSPFQAGRTIGPVTAARQRRTARNATENPAKTTD